MISVEKNAICIKWFKDGKLHRDNDQPAEIYADGTRCWYKDGKPHRDNDLPAVIYAIGTQYWYKDGIKYIPNESHTIQEKPLSPARLQQSIIDIVVESLKDTDYKSIQETSDGILIKY